MLCKLVSCLSVSFVESTLAVWTHRAARNPGQGYPRPTLQGSCTPSGGRDGKDGGSVSSITQTPPRLVACRFPLSARPSLARTG